VEASTCNLCTLPRHSESCPWLHLTEVLPSPLEQMAWQLLARRHSLQGCDGCLALAHPRLQPESQCQCLVLPSGRAVCPASCGPPCIASDWCALPNALQQIATLQVNVTCLKANVAPEAIIAELRKSTV
jgi:hypothetical protein